MEEKVGKPRHKVIKKEKSISSKSNSMNIWMITSILLGIILLISLFTGGFGLMKPSVKSLLSDVNSLKSKTSDANLKSTLESVATQLTPYQAVTSEKNSNYNGKKVLITEYSDFQCPFCKRANDDAITKLKKNFGAAIEIEYKHFPLSFHPNAQKAAEASECARDQGKFWEYHDKLFANQGSLDISSLKRYADSLSLDTTKFNACLDNGEKAGLVQTQFSEGQSKGVSGTPAFFINGKMIEGAQPYESFLPLICAQIPDHETCKNAPKPVIFNLYVIEDKRCTNCDTTGVINTIGQIFPGANVQKLDYSSSKGKELYDISGLVYLPMYVLESKAKDDVSFSKVQQALVQKGDYYFIQPSAVNSKFNPAKPEGSKSAKPVVELFVMSHCPYGTQAEKGILPAVKTLGDKIDFKVRFVYYAMHGKTEVDEQLAQYCMQKEQPVEYLKYLACFLNASDSAGCIKSTGIDTQKLDACKIETDSRFEITKNFNDKSSWLNGRFPKFNTDLELNNKYGVGGSPTLIINGDESTAGRDSASYLAAICSSFITPPAECNTQLSSTPTGPGFGYDSVGQASAAGCGV